MSQEKYSKPNKAAGGNAVQKDYIDGSKAHEYNGVVLFWNPPHAFSQWTYSKFTIDGKEYTCAEQYMMAEKARLFTDTDIEDEIMKIGYDPKSCKNLGRQVENYD
mmetsp:Transcript_10963/g.17962  ORF Transcript_10963/g.17962 Transcript_10963/m.17962 type:complete len:105 (+) Transcript_10963:225-539(+)